MKGFCSVPRPPDCSEGFVRCGSVRQFEPILDTQQVVGARPANQGFRALEIDFRRGHFGERFNLFSQPGHHTGVPSPADMVLIPPAGAQQISPCKPGHQRVADSWRDSAIVPAGGLAVVGKPSRNACRLLVCLVPQKQGPFLRGSSVCRRMDLPQSESGALRNTRGRRQCWKIFRVACRLLLASDSFHRPLKNARTAAECSAAARAWLLVEKQWNPRYDQLFVRRRRL